MEIKFINTDIKELPNKLTEKYDYIYLSNIMQQVKYVFESDTSKINLLSKYKKIIKQLDYFLNEDGVIVISYFFYCNFKTVEQVFNKKHFEYKIFCNQNTNDDKNAILQHTKRTTSK